MGDAFFGSPFAFRFAGTRDTGVGAGAVDEWRELSLDMGVAAAGSARCRDGFRVNLSTVGGGVDLGEGSALERMLEKAMGSAGRLGVW